MQTRSKTEIYIPKIFTYSITNVSTMEPNSASETLERSELKQVMNEVFEALKRNNT